MMEAIGVGVALGFFNGLLSMWFLRWAMPKPDKVFYNVWLGGVMYRMAFVVLLFFLLIKYPLFPVVPTVLAVILAQLLIQVIPLRAVRIER